MIADPTRVQIVIQHGSSATRFELPEGDSDHVQAHIARTKTFYELPLLEHAACYLKPGDLVIDVGAHIGNHTLFFANVCGAKVLAIEPNEASFARLGRHIELNALSDSVMSRRVAAGRTPSRGTVISQDASNSGRSSVSVSSPVDGDVEVLPIDQLANGLRPALIKIDVEGMELDVLLGAEQLVREARPIIYVESFSHATLERIATLLVDWGFVLGPRFNATTTFCFIPVGEHGLGQLSLQSAHYQMDAFVQYRALARRLEDVAQSRAQSADQVQKSLASLQAELAAARSALNGLEELRDDRDVSHAFQKQTAIKLSEIDELRDILRGVIVEAERGRAERRAAEERLASALKRTEAQLSALLSAQRGLLREVTGHPGLKLLPTNVRKKFIKLQSSPNAFFADARSPFVRSTVKHLYDGNLTRALVSTLPETSQRKLAKLERDPQAFFKDSRNPLLRALGPRAHGLLRSRKKPAKPVRATIQAVRKQKRRDPMPAGTYEMPKWSFVVVPTGPQGLDLCASLARSLPTDAELVVVTTASRWQSQAAELLDLSAERYRIYVLAVASDTTLMNFGLMHATGATIVLSSAESTRQAIDAALRPLDSIQAGLVSGEDGTVLLLAQSCIARVGYFVVDAARPFDEYVKRASRVFGREAVLAPHEPDTQLELATDPSPPIGHAAEVCQPFVDKHARSLLDDASIEHPVRKQDDFLVYRVPRPGVPFAETVKQPYAVCFQRRPKWMNALRELDGARKPLISVVMTAYNAVGTLEFAINSILEQTYRNLELIVVDDCSSDRTLELCLRMAQADSRVKVLHAPQNSGTYWCKNFGIAHSAGEYITFHDADDIAAASRLELQAAALVADPQAAASITCYQRFDSLSNLIWIGGQKDRAARISLMIHRSAMLRVGYFDSVRVAADDECLARVKIATRRNIVRLPCVQYWALLTDGSLTTSGPAPIHYEGAGVRLSPIRRAYWDAAKAWHTRLESSKETPYLAFPLLRRPFPAPEQLCPTRRQEPNTDVVATMATMPSRVGVLEPTVKSLLPQVDRLHVYLNNFDRVPEFLKHSKIRIARSQEHGDLKDNGKFFFLPQLGSCFHFTVDDDIVYPADYVQKSVLALERYRRQVVIGVHGVNLAEPLVRYTRGRDVLHFNEALSRDEFVQLLGTGTVAYHTSALALRVEDFGRPGMADLWFAIAARRQGVPLVAQARRQAWLSGLEVGEERLYAVARKNDKFETATAQKHGPWTRELRQPPREAIARWSWEAHGPVGLSLLHVDVAAMARLTGRAPQKVVVASVGTDSADQVLGRQRLSGFDVTAVVPSPAALNWAALGDVFLVMVLGDVQLKREALRLIAEQLLIDPEAQLVIDASGDPLRSAIVAVSKEVARSALEGQLVTNFEEVVRRLRAVAKASTVRVVHESLIQPAENPTV